MIYVTGKTASIVLSSVLVLFLTFILYPSVLVAILPSAILLYLLVSLITFKPRISVTSYITPAIVEFGKYANVNIKVRSLEKVYIEVYDNPPDTVEVVKGKLCYKGILDKDSYVEFAYSIVPLIPGSHEWRPLRIHVRDSLGLFEDVILYDIPRKLDVEMPKNYTKILLRIPAHEVSGMREHYEPLFDRVKPYAPGDSLKRLVFRSLLMPGGLRVKSFVSEAYGKVLKPRELRVIFLVGKDFMRFFHKAYNLALYGVYRFYIEASILGLSFNIVLGKFFKHIKDFNELNIVLNTFKGMTDEELLVTLKKYLKGIIIVDYLTLFKFHRELLRTDAPILVIMPIPNNNELLNEIDELGKLLKELKRKYVKETLALNFTGRIYLISCSLDFERFIEEVL